MKSRFNPFLVAIVLAVIPFSSASFAADIYKDSSITDLNVLSSWSTASGAGVTTPDPTVFNITDNWYFNDITLGASKTLNLGGNMTIGGLDLDNTTTTSPGNTYNLVINGIAGQSLTLNGGTLSGTGVSGGGSSYSTTGILLNRSVGGSLTIGANIIVGATQQWVTSRGLTIGGTVDLGSGTARTLTINTATTTLPSITGTIGGSTGNINKSGNGSLYLNNSGNTFGGNVTVAGGTLSVVKLAVGGASSSIGSGVSTITLNGGTLNYLGSTTDTTDRSITMAAGAAISNSGSGTVSFTAANVVQSGTATARTLTLSGSNTTANTFGSILGNSGTGTNLSSLTKAGAGTWVVAGANTYTGGTTVTLGTLRLGATNAIPGNTYAGDVSVTGTLDMNGFSDAINGLNGAGTVDNSAAGTPTLTVGSNGNIGSFSGVVKNTAGTLAVTKSGAGTQTLSGASTYTGATTVNAGRLNVTGSLTSAIIVSGGAISGTGTTTGSLTLNTGSTIALAGGATPTSLTSNGVIFSGPTTLSFLTAPVNATVYTVVTYGAGGMTGLANLTAPGYRGTFTDDAANTRITFTSGGFGATRTWNTTTGTWAIATGTNFIEGDQMFATGDNVIFGDIASDAAITLSGHLAPGTLNITNSANTYTFTGVAGTNDITGATALAKSGAGTLILASANTYTGGTTISAGTLKLGAINAIPGNTYAGDVSVTGTLDMNSFSGAINGLNGGGTVDNTAAGTPTLTVGANGNSGTFTGIIQNTAGTLALAKSGAGTLTLSGASTYNGGTTLNGGILRVSTNDSALGSGAITVAGSSTLATASGGGARTLANAIAINASQTLSLDSGYANLTLNGPLSGSGTLNIGNGTSILGGTNPSFTGAITSGSLNNTLSVPGSLAAASFTASYAGTLTVAGSLTLSGALSVSVGGTETVSGAGSMTIGSSSVKNYSAVTFGASGTTLTDSGNFTLGDASSQYGNWNQSAGTLNLISATSGAIRVGHYTSETSTYSLSGGTLNVPTIAVSLGWDGNGTLNISGGTANLKGIRISDNSAVTGIIGLTGGTLNLGSSGIVKGNSSGTATVNLGAAIIGASADWTSSLAMTLTDTATGTTFNTLDSVDNTTAHTITLSGVLSSTGKVVKSGVGTLALSGVNTYTGDTVINAGTFKISGAGLLNSGNYAGAITIATASTLEYNSSASQTLSGVISGAGGLKTSSSGTLTLPGSNTYTGVTTLTSGTLLFTGTSNLGSTGGVAINAGTLSIGASGIVTTGAIGNTSTTGASLTIASGGVLNATTYSTSYTPATFNIDGTLNLSGSLTFSINAGKTITGTGTINAAGYANNNYSVITFGAQRLNLGASGITISNPGSITLNGTTLGASANWSSSASLVLSGAEIINTLDSVDNTTGRTITLAGVLSGAGSLTKTGSGTLTLSGVNTYAGNTVVNAGTLTLAVGGQLKFVIGVTSGASNSLSGPGSLAINGHFAIDTTAASALTSGSWTLVSGPSLASAFGATFSVVGFTDAGNNKWTKDGGNNKLWTFDKSTGVLTLGSAASFTSWIDGFTFPSGADKSATGDPDNDGINNAAEMVLGGNPATGMDAALLPTCERVTTNLGAGPAEYLLFTYRRTALSVAASVTSNVQSGSDLNGWSPAVDGQAGVIIQTDVNFFDPASPNTDRVRVYIPCGLNTALFARLDITVP